MRSTIALLALVGTFLQAQSFPGPSNAGSSLAWAQVLDTLELSRAQLECLKAELAWQSTDFWHRLIPAVTLSASYAIGGITFFDGSNVNGIIVPTDQYRLTLSLSLSGLIHSTEHERARIVNEQVQLDLRLEQTRRLMERQVISERAARLRAELALLEEELRLTERIHRYYRTLFDQGKTSFDVLVRAELRVIEVRQKVLQMRSDLEATSVN